MMAVADFGGSVLGRFLISIEVMQGGRSENKADRRRRAGDGRWVGLTTRAWICWPMMAPRTTLAGLRRSSRSRRDKKRIFVMSTPTATACIGKQCSGLRIPVCRRHLLCIGQGRRECGFAVGEGWRA